MKELVCSKCKKSFTSTSERYKTLAENAGGEDKLKETYLCKKCRSDNKTTKEK